jgi:glycosyltransferase involved in cell wall biosynthesis
MNDHRRLRIAIDCRISNIQQGHGRAIPALASSLSGSDDAGQEYTFIVNDEFKEWLRPYIFGPCQLMIVPMTGTSRLKRVARKLVPFSELRGAIRKKLPAPISDGRIESENFDLVHFPTQTAYRTSLPSIYQPWDLQHRHYPQFFTKAECDLRERWYRLYCEQATFVCVQTHWTKEDVVRSYELASEKVVVIPWGTMFDVNETSLQGPNRNVLDRHHLPEKFFFYPAVTWPHKNHDVIIRALHLLKTQYGRRMEVCFTGASTDYRSTLDAMALNLGVADQLHYLGFVPAEELRSLFACAIAMIFPSKFEGFGMPILEAFHARLPVLSSKTTVLPEVAQDGAAYFDPDSPSELAALMTKVLENAAFREELVERGSATLAFFSMKETAARFQKLYKRTAAQGINARVPAARRTERAER